MKDPDRTRTENFLEGVAGIGINQSQKSKGLYYGNYVGLEFISVKLEVCSWKGLFPKIPYVLLRLSMPMRLPLTTSLRSIDPKRVRKVCFSVVWVCALGTMGNFSEKK